MHYALSPGKAETLKLILGQEQDKVCSLKFRTRLERAEAILSTLLRNVLLYNLYLVYLVIQTGLVIKGVKDTTVNLPGPPWKHNFLHVSFGFIKMKHLLCLRKKPERLHQEFSDPHLLPDHTFCCCTESFCQYP